MASKSRPKILSEQGFDSVIQVISTKGDRVLEKPLPEIGGKGLFTQELEQSLINGSTDIAVHSAKDLPTTDPEGLCVAAFMKREKCTDCLVSSSSNSITSIPELPFGANVGTSSLRRQAQILNLRPDLKVSSIRGNVDTRIKKMLSKEVDILVLASAGVIRLGFDKRSDLCISHLDELSFLPAVGQGSIAIQCRQNDLNLFQCLTDKATHHRIIAERELLKRLEGGCSLPLGVKSEYLGQEQVRLRAKLLSLDGKMTVESTGKGNLTALWNKS